MMASHHKLGAAFVTGCIIAGVALSATSTTQSRGQLAGSITRIDVRTMPYAQFRTSVAEGFVADVTINDERIVGRLKGGEKFATVPIPGDTALRGFLSDNGVRVSEQRSKP